MDRPGVSSPRPSRHCLEQNGLHVLVSGSGCFRTEFNGNQASPCRTPPEGWPGKGTAWGSQGSRGCRPGGEAQLRKSGDPQPRAEEEGEARVCAEGRKREGRG